MSRTAENQVIVDTFDAFGRKAEVEYQVLLKTFTPEQKDALEKVQDWIKRWTKDAGVKRPCYIIRDTRIKFT